MHLGLLSIRLNVTIKPFVLHCTFCPLGLLTLRSCAFRPNIYRPYILAPFL